VLGELLREWCSGEGDSGMEAGGGSPSLRPAAVQGEPQGGSCSLTHCSP